MSQALLHKARSNVDMMKAMVAASPQDGKLQSMLSQAETTMQNLEASMGVQVQQVNGAVAAPAQPQAKTLEQRVAALENVAMQLAQAAQPAVSAATQAGMDIMAALGAAMTDEQKKFVQARLQTSPQFFASENCKVALDLWLQEWLIFEGAAK